MISEVYNIDCMDFMRQFPDKYFELAIVDPPYGLGKRTTSGGGGKNKQSEKWKNHDWDNTIPSIEYFNELKRVSKNYIVWGGNYMLEHLNNCRCFITWDKMVYIPTMSQIELALTSFDLLPQLIKINNNDSNRMHPTQKPVDLYRWLLQNYAKQGDKILDTHLGSGSSRIACDMEGFDFYGCELDQDYFEAHQKRWTEYKKQLTLF